MNPRVRPSFLIPTQLAFADFCSCLQREIVDSDQRFETQFTREHAIVSIAPDSRHFWSPWLHLEIRIRAADGETEVRELFGRFSPHPSIWTAVMFSSLSLVVLSFFCVVLGTAQLLTSELPWGYLLIPLWCAMGGGIWLISQIGQRLAMDQMATLKAMVTASLDQPLLNIAGDLEEDRRH